MHHRDSGGAIISRALQQLEMSGYITKKSGGRIISNEGMKKVDRLATEIYKDFATVVVPDCKDMPDRKY